MTQGVKAGLRTGRVSQPSLFLALLAGVAVLAVAILLVSTAHGPGIGGDATIYLTSAQNLVDGNGLGLIGPEGAFRLLPYFPPLYPLVLSVFAALGMDLAAVANWLNVLLFGALAWLVGSATFRYSGAAVPALLAALLVALSPVLIPVFSWAMSEPLAILLGFLGLVMLLESFTAPHRTGLVLLAGLLTGLGMLTRYANAAFLLAGVVGLLFLAPASWRQKLLRSIFYGAVSVIPVLAWMIYDLSTTATVSSRSVESAAGMLSRLAAFPGLLRDVLLFWLIPDSWVGAPPYPQIVNSLLAVALVAVLAATFTAVMLRMRRLQVVESSRQPQRLAWLLMIFLAAYVLVVAAVYVTTYPPITIASRMLSPANVAFVWLAALLVHLAVTAWPRVGWLKTVLLAGLLLFAGWYGLRSARIVQQNAALGIGYTSVAWQESETIAAVGALPADVTIVTNEEMAVLFLTGRASYPLAEIFASQPYSQFTRYGEGDLTSDLPQRMFQQGEAVLVLFDSIESQLESVYADRAVERLRVLTGGLETVQDLDDGAIYRYQP
jgi:hypothetical protein